MSVNEKKIEALFRDVRVVIADCLRASVLSSMADELAGVVGTGKMLRVRMMCRLGAVTGVPAEDLVRAAATVEMMHAASLLHDDVIDGAVLRRSVPAFWVTKGAAGAVLLGDLLVCQAFKLISMVDNGRLVSVCVDLATEMCEAEVEQELLLKGKTPDWRTCVDIARRKTGSLFALAGCAAGGKDEKLCKALMNAGYAAGTAYQLADDILDAHGDQDMAGKTLGSDAVLRKITAASSWRASNVDPHLFIRNLLSDSEEMLLAWPDVAGAWGDYLRGDLIPVIDSFLGSFSVQAV
jgi:geranylgeranyl pyrophosphate synthase